jgi:hypothetical protein
MLYSAGKAFGRRENEQKRKAEVKEVKSEKCKVKSAK